MGYLLLHSAFGPSSVQLREKTAREGKGRGDTEHGEDWASPRASRWAKMRHTDRAGLSPFKRPLVEATQQAQDS